MQADCLEKVVKRNLDDTVAEILFEKEEPERREVPHILLQETPAYVEAVRNPVRDERISLTLEPMIDQRFDEIPKAAVEQHQGRQALISHSVRQVMKYSQTKGRTFTLISDHSKKTIKEQSNVEAFELLELTKKVQCTHGHRYKTSGHVYCYCGRTVVFANKNHVKVRFPHETSLSSDKGPSRGSKFGTSTEQQERGKAKEALHYCEEKDSYPFFTDGTEMMYTEPLEEMLAGPKKP